MAQIKWEPEELVDPYPAAIEILGGVWLVALAQGAMSDEEAEVLGAMQLAALDVLKEKDPASVGLFVGPGGETGF